MKFNHKVVETFYHLVDTLGLNSKQAFLTKVANGYYSNIIEFVIDNISYQLTHNINQDDVNVNSENFEDSFYYELLLKSEQNHIITETTFNDDNSKSAFVDVFKEYYRSITVLDQISNFFKNSCPIFNNQLSTFEISSKVDTTRLRNLTLGLEIDDNVTYHSSFDNKVNVWVDEDSVGSWDLSVTEVQRTFDNLLKEFDNNVDYANSTSQIIVNIENKIYIIFVDILTDQDIDALSIDSLHVSQDSVRGQLFGFFK